MMVNAATVFTQAQLDDMKKFISINSELKVLEGKKKTLSDKIKGYMTTLKVNECDVSGTTFTVSNSVRRTVTKATKDEFVALLIKNKKQHLVTTSIEPDVDSIFAEVDAGLLDKSFVDTYVKTTPVKTLKTS